MCMMFAAANCFGACMLRVVCFLPIRALNCVEQTPSTSGGPVRAKRCRVTVIVVWPCVSVCMPVACSRPCAWIFAALGISGRQKMKPFYWFQLIRPHEHGLHESPVCRRVSNNSKNGYTHSINIGAIAPMPMLHDLPSLNYRS